MAGDEGKTDILARAERLLSRDPSRCPMDELDKMLYLYALADEQVRRLALKTTDEAEIDCLNAVRERIATKTTVAAMRGLVLDNVNAVLWCDKVKDYLTVRYCAPKWFEVVKALTGSE